MRTLQQYLNETRATPAPEPRIESTAATPVIEVDPQIQNIAEAVEPPQVRELTPEDYIPVTNPADFPEYMLSDTMMVGYESADEQAAVYGFASQGIFNAQTKTVLDVGCGRGDFGEYIHKLINPTIEYVGVDLNPVLINVGKVKYQETPQFQLENRFFSPYALDETRKYDVVFHIHDLTLNYGVFQNERPNAKYEILEQYIYQSLKICNQACVFILMNDNAITDQLNHFSFTPVSQILFDAGVRFAIDQTEFPNMFKLIIFK